MTLGDLMALVISALERHGVPFMVTGSLASSYHGEPRATRDIDVVIDPDANALEDLVEDLQDAGLYVDREAARSAYRDRSQFNAIADGAAKVDFIVRRDRAFSVEEFGRRRPADLLGTRGFIVSAEDLVIAKLEWASESASELQLRDVRAMLEVGGASIDHTHIERWVAQLGVGELWQRVTSEH